MEKIYPLLQAVIQGFLEFLPVSIEGHLAVFDHFTRRISGGSAIPYYINVFRFGSLLAILIVYWKLILNIVIEAMKMIREIFSGKFSFRDMRPERNLVFMLPLSLVPMILLAFFGKYIDALRSESSIIATGCIFMAMGILMYIADSRYPGSRELSKMNVPDALLLGVSQTAAFGFTVPNAGPAVSVTLLRGYSDTSIVSFSLLMYLPAMLFSNISALDRTAVPESIADAPGWIIPAGVVAAMIFGWVSIKFLQWLVSDVQGEGHLGFFAKYNTIIGGLILALTLIESVLGTTFYDIFKDAFSFLGAGA
ncbi:MAG: undecaprenyl-diphosphate phosphatase [Oscillospiraceae bacterium]|nr:undecaprenyl-diphosphate phosphatase [Oscillospiraceae bacterium]